MYIASPPTYNSVDQTLDYKVIAPHYLPDGKEFKGMYNLVIKSDVARCIYGFSAAPVKATISIVSSDGTAQVATTVVGERDGWLYLSANNFTFSSPIVKVKLSQDKAVATPEKTVEKTGRTDIPLCWNMALHLLRTREFERGWKYWELGFDKEVGTMGRNLPGLLKIAKRADHQDKIDTDKWTMISVEQGIGDQVLFLSAMDQAIEEFKKVIFVCESRMAPIIRRSFPEIEIAQPGIIEAWNECHLPNNGFIPLGSILPRYRPTLESFTERRRPFLQVDGDLYANYHAQLRDIAKGRPIVGISWKGGYWENQKRNKALEIENWLPIFEQGALCVNLQYGETSKEQAFIAERGYEMLNFPKLDFKKDLDHWLALSAACDGIISVSTALVHFAGACGQKVAVIMPEPQGPWILGTDDQWSIAYPDVLLFRRHQDEHVRHLVDRVARVIVS